jgi:hypothetical protein
VQLTSNRFIPGPGTYDPKTSINKTGVYTLSTMNNTMTPSFSVPTMNVGR